VFDHPGGGAFRRRAAEAEVAGWLTFYDSYFEAVEFSRAKIRIHHPPRPGEVKMPDLQKRAEAGYCLLSNMR
jgi:hypothetical protein